MKYLFAIIGLIVGFAGGAFGFYKFLAWSVSEPLSN